MQTQRFLVGLGRALREERERQELSQEQLGLSTGVHRNYIGGIERGERSPTVAVIATLCAELGVRPSQLIRRAEQLAR